MALDAVIAYVREQALDLSRGTIVATVLGVWLLNRIVLVFYRLYLDPLSKFPGPKLAAATSLYEMYYDVVEDGTFVWKMDELHRKYGPIVRISPHSLRLRKSSAYHEIYRMGTPFIKEIKFYRLFGLTQNTFSSIDPDIHRRRRSLLEPAFSRKGVLGHEFMVREKVDLLCRLMKEHETQDKFFDCYRGFAALTVDVVTDFAYAKNYDALSTPDFDNLVIDAFDSQQEVFLVLKHFPLMAKMMNALPSWVLIHMMRTGAGWADLQLDAKVQLRALYARVCAGEVEKNTLQRSLFGGIFAEHPDLKNIDPAELTQEGMGVVAAGVHTTRWALCVGLVEVAGDPLIQTKLYEELKMASPDINAEFSYTQCEKLPYLRGVMLEMLRLSYGVIGPLPRRVPKEGAVIGGYHLPGGSTIEMDCYSLHHDEDIFPDSHRFWPERWLTPESKQNEKFVITFGAGPRQCVGINLAMSEMYLAFATIFRRFNIDTSIRGGERLKIKDHWLPILRNEPLKCKVISRKE